jgi:hypothetical protein
MRHEDGRGSRGKPTGKTRLKIMVHKAASPVCQQPLTSFMNVINGNMKPLTVFPKHVTASGIM